MGHEERFPLTRLSVGCEFSKETIAGMCGNGRDAPIPAVRLSWVERVKPDPYRPSAPATPLSRDIQRGVRHLRVTLKLAVDPAEQRTRITTAARYLDGVRE